jgi:hypothetical protein
VELFTLVLMLAAMWMSQTPEPTDLTEQLPPARRRAIVVDAVAALLAA